MRTSLRVSPRMSRPNTVGATAKLVRLVSVCAVAAALSAGVASAAQAAPAGQAPTTAAANAPGDLIWG
ncbi:hypothetical protein [Streptomyces sp. NPDC046939]|uniref:hypothetical protein n=1 Tax=Streptomyces sp. NPDC046939 TaxID=3155376 RepID=UPI0033F74174